MAQSLLVHSLNLLHFDSLLPLVNNVLKLMLVNLGEDVLVTIEIIHLLLLHIGDLRVDYICIDLVVWVEHNDVSLQLLDLLRRHHNLAVRSAGLHEMHDLLEVELVLVTEGLHLALLINEASIVLHPLVKLSELVIADVQEVLL